MPSSAKCGRRSIPACAGEADFAKVSSDAIEVYPRVCGGSILLPGPNGTEIGLSPRVRGKPRPVNVTGGANGSIPACAGEAASGRPISLR